MLLTLLRPHFLELCDLFLLFCELLPFVFFLFATLGLTFSSLFDSIPVESSFSSSSPKSNNSRLSSSSLSSTGIFRRFWLVDFDLPGFGGLATLRGVRRGLGLGSSRSLSSTVFFCRFLAAGVRPFWARFVLPKEKKPLLHNAFYSEKCPGKVLFLKVRLWQYCKATNSVHISHGTLGNTGTDTGDVKSVLNSSYQLTDRFSYLMWLFQA